MYQNQLKHLVSQDMYDICMAHIGKVKEVRHLKVWTDKIKFDKLWQQKSIEDQNGPSKPYIQMAIQTRNNSK